MQRLASTLAHIDGRGYKAYKALEGRYDFGDFTLLIDHVQGDPFAEPSRIRLCLNPAQSRLPDHSFANPSRRLALEDFLCRRLAATIQAETRGRRGSGRSGEVRIAPCGQEVLLRDAVVVQAGAVEARLGLALPAAGRRILAAEAHAMLLEELPRVVHQGLHYPSLDAKALNAHLGCLEDQHALRRWLHREGLVAFVANGALLPRRSGIDDRPLGEGAVPFEAPPSLARCVQLPHAGEVCGMAIAAGVTLVVGGGFHGKSTLLQALQRGVYDHIPGDGREQVVCEGSAVKIRAEDGRCVSRVNISGFIDNLPLGRDTRRFSTDNASGSTSQAANIMEAIACGCRTLLIDEDTSATNLMIRDRRMQQLVAPEQEPITPLIDRIRDLYRHHGVSSILVTGGSSAYLDVADRVLMLQQYRTLDATGQARALCGGTQPVGPDGPLPLDSVRQRLLAAPPEWATPTKGRAPKVQALDGGWLRLGEQRLDLGRVEQLVDAGQSRAVGHLLRCWLADVDPEAPVLTQLQAWISRLEEEGMTALSPFAPEPHGGLSLPRCYEVYAALNRLRCLAWR
ncbi:ABC-ATPase domain-containing protein [Motiliproteus sp. SC1-56]|uniref:ABC-ATPase domain-containing protein n=1 Tax=Motiliproteus sp. SC1-56 TaxID=2799565 RepID=UPI001A8E8EE2|nr:ABC-ATPase domain-containing protein [Motiliproteus sp. SC1-56]